MKLPTDTIEHNGEEYTVSYNEWFTCTNCGEAQERTEPNNENEDYRDEPESVPHCRNCTGRTEMNYTKEFHLYMKYAIAMEDPPLDAGIHADELRNLADKFEALEANGWELTESDGVHIRFEKSEGTYSS